MAPNSRCPHLNPVRNDFIVILAELLREHDDTKVRWQKAPDAPLLGIKLPGVGWASWQLPLNRIPSWVKRERYPFSEAQTGEAEFRVLRYLDSY